MGFQPNAIRGAGPGVVDYRLARAGVLAEYRRGNVGATELCDAHPELRRAAQSYSRPTGEDCPICSRHQLVLVSYVFGPRLPPHGRCVQTAAEIDAIAVRDGRFQCFVVEVCPNCGWNHLAQTFDLGD
ncbi:MAG: DUF5318 domain-containing protein [Actinomycetia bacterium]|nr:DUF5318 domain-containing protein [Actinomycetes bacterium]MCP3913222.1 DUF5318 domain-containing protein [Actinomycetes bacterium]MCP4084924.1 DUF5318 domain-containing protein [Actinomycetes bacterium]